MLLFSIRLAHPWQWQAQNEAPPQPTILSQSELSNKYGSVLSVNPSQPTVTGAPANETGGSGEGGPGQGGERGEAPPDGFKAAKARFGLRREPRGRFKKRYAGILKKQSSKASVFGKVWRSLKKALSASMINSKKGLERRAEQNFDSKF